MEGFSSQREQQLHHSSALPYCFLSEPEPLPVPGFPASSNLEEAATAAMAYESSSSSSLDTSSMSMVYSPVLLQLQESHPSFEAAAGGGGGGKRRMVAIEGSSTTSLGSTQEMDGGGGKSSRKQRRRNNAGVKALQEKKARGHGDVKAKEAAGEPPAGYIHVRARRGQATDSHSLAERVRREKISERMKMLQSLVPGCDKVTGKALMLDEIISYVQSLQNQVEFLSMKLASLNPMMYEFGLDIDMYSNVPQVLKMGMAQIPHELVQCMGQGNQLPTGAPHTSLEVEEAQGPTGFVQDGGSSSMMQVGGEQGLEGSESLHQVEFSSMCFFQ